MKSKTKKIIAASTISMFLLQVIYVTLEPSVATAASTSDNVIVTLNVDSGISISNGSDVTMTPNIGLLSNKSVGSSAWNVKTSSALGYTLGVKASSSPALVNATASDSFDDYTPVSAGVPDAWGGVASGHKEFGFSAYGNDVNATTWGSYTTCGNTSSGVPDASANYLGFATSDETIATSNSITPSSGTITNICFAAEQNGTYAASGAFTATITATATTN